MSRRSTAAAAGALACMAALLPLWALAFRSARGERVDRVILHGFYDLRRQATITLAHAGTSLADPIPFVLLGTALALTALALGRRRLAVAVPVILLAANTTTQVLKPLLAESRQTDFLGLRGQIAAASWPSGHSTAAFALALCAVLVAPPARRAIVALVAAGFVAAVSGSVVLLGWHYPSDVVGGYLVAAAWTLAGVAVLALLERPDARRARPPVAVRRRYGESAPASAPER